MHGARAKLCRPLNDPGGLSPGCGPSLFKSALLKGPITFLRISADSEYRSTDTMQFH
jgi:hypothetical protein